MGVADHARRESRRIFSKFIYITSRLSYHLEQKFSKNSLPCSVQPMPDRQTDGWTHEHSEIIYIDYIYLTGDIFRRRLSSAEIIFGGDNFRHHFCQISALISAEMFSKIKFLL